MPSLNDLKAFLATAADKPTPDELKPPPGADTSVENLKQLHTQHVTRYLNRLKLADSGETGYRATELRELLRAWRLVEENGFVFDKLPLEAKVEVYDALYDQVS